ncbi:MAG TPA: aminopeptidase P N-terminal domain-containing protein, partial [Candidatus Babeliales bacterium]|nr:aminopeptidase P N-terminal domain-containing protein [Candidatus Babeliales bacterium]
MSINSGIVPTHLMSAITPQIYAERRQKLLALLRTQYPDSTGTVLLFGALEQDGVRFQQERTFYYFSGVTEPGAVLLLDVVSGASTLLVPHTNQQREQWIHQPVMPTVAWAQQLGLDQVQYWGEPIKG